MIQVLHELLLVHLNDAPVVFPIFLRNYVCLHAKTDVPVFCSSSTSHTVIEYRQIPLPEVPLGDAISILDDPLVGLAKYPLQAVYRPLVVDDRIHYQAQCQVRSEARQLVHPESFHYVDDRLVRVHEWCCL